ncbi:MAG: carbamoyltransferase [Candidatus Omnitrophica bacterium]|nr:carbamoyltransferase [Candidatus Omnitrophota bacterium]
MIILGINAYHPDSSACIIKDGRLIAAVEEERFLRIKHWAGFPKESIRYCLKEAGIGLEEIDYIVLNRDPRANFYKKVIFALLNRPSFSLVRDRLHNMLKIETFKDTLSKEFLIPKEKIKAKIYTVEHHRAHLASSFFVSPFEHATVISIDGFGDFTSCMAAKGNGNKLEVLYEINYPHSLGIFYTAFTQFLGFDKFGDEYKVMGLCAYGKPDCVKEMEDILMLKPHGRFALDLSYFSFYKSRDCMLWNNAAPVLERLYSDKLIEKFGPPRRYEEEITPAHLNIAASVQRIYEKAFFHILNYAYERTKIYNLCLAGGCALNSLANGQLFDNTPFKEVYIQPAASDAGGSLGAAYYLYCQLMGNKRIFVMDKAYWGSSFSEKEMKAAIDEKKNQLNTCSIERIEDEDELCRKTAGFIAQGKIIGWFQGRMEWGPRALGNRSILVDPRKKDMKDILNARIKKREWFRPFAPSILLEKVSEFFEKDYPDPFMLKVYPIKMEKRSLIPAVVHADGTGRLQTVKKEENPLYWKLIKEFENITGVPVLLNTSFNENEPIVNTPIEALDCFLRTKMDVLVMGKFLITRQ